MTSLNLSSVTLWIVVDIEMKFPVTSVRGRAMASDTVAATARTRAAARSRARLRKLTLRVILTLGACVIVDISFSCSAFLVLNVSSSYAVSPLEICHILPEHLSKRCHFLPNSKSGEKSLEFAGSLEY